MDASGREEGDHGGGVVRWLVAGIRVLAMVFAWGIVTTLMLKVLFADRWFLLKFPFYVPGLVALPLGVLAALVMRGGWQLRAALALTSMVLGACSVTIDQPLFLRAPAGAPRLGSLRVMTYNVMAYNISESRIAAAIREADPDVLCVVEGTFGHAPPMLVKLLGNDYQWAVGKRLSIATRKRLLDSEMILDEPNVKALRARIDVAGREVHVVAVDVKPPVRRDDHAAFDELYTAVQLQAAEGMPFTLSGDFNIPRGSHHLRRATTGLTDSFMEAPAGRHLATWPAWLPLWQIDHAFHSPQVRATNSQVLTAYGSDHLPIVVDYVFSGDGSDGPR